MNIKNNELLDKQETVPEEIGNIKIADEVISIVASLAAQEVPGVLDMGGGLAEGFNELIGKRKRYRGVRMQVDGRFVDVAVYVFVQYGACIPEIALEIQSKVKNAIEDMTGYEVKNIDIHIQGVLRRPKTKLEESFEKNDNDIFLGEE